MKAFVIKNKEGKYYDCWSLGFTDTINECAIYQDRQTAENDIKNCIKDNEWLGYKDDCEVVEITISENDLEQQLAEKDEEIEELKMSVLFEQEHKNKALDKLKEIRKQVCDRVNHHLDNLVDEANSGCLQYLTIDLFEFQDFLERVEQGEEI